MVRAQLANWSLSMNLTESQEPLGLWEAHVNVPVSVGTGADGDLFFPSGLRRSFRDPFVSTGGAVEGAYPSGGCVMQCSARRQTQHYLPAVACMSLPLTRKVISSSPTTLP